MSKAKAASPKKGEAAKAVAEVDEAPTVEWEGLTLHLRTGDEIPTSHKFDLIDFGENPTDVSLLKLVKNILQPADFEEVRSRFAQQSGEDGDRLLGQLFVAVMGIEPGESQASD